MVGYQVLNACVKAMILALTLSAIHVFAFFSYYYMHNFSFKYLALSVI